MACVLYIATYLGAICFVVGCVRRIRQYAFLPLHLRWELYPVPHEAPSRALHGGSYFEESDWWTKPRRFNYAGELRAMALEILLFKNVRDSNRPLWWRSFSFHLGLYCVSAFVIAQVLLLVFLVAGFHSTPTLLIALTFLGRAGLWLTVLGSAALLWRRMTDEESRDYTHVADHAHLAIISLASGLVLAGSFGASAANAGSLLRGLISFDTTIRVPALLTAGILLAVAMLAYIPYSHMAHFIAKYFTYHSVRWDDRPSHGNGFDAQMSRSLAYRPTWAAVHIGADGQKTWADVATVNPTTTKEVGK
jgi:nitrate reductase gamma subunit